VGWYPVTLQESDLPSVRTGTTKTTCQLPDSAIWRGVHCPAGGGRPPVLTRGQLPPPTYNDTGRQAFHWQPPAHPAAPNPSCAVLRPRLVPYLYAPQVENKWSRRLITWPIPPMRGKFQSVGRLIIVLTLFSMNNWYTCMTMQEESNVEHENE
jgi:hypothetical protein